MHREPTDIQMGLENGTMATKLERRTETNVNIKKTTSLLNNSSILSLRDITVLTYLKRKCNYRVKRNRVPKEIKIIVISKKLRISYKQARSSIDRLVKNGSVERWTVYYLPNRKKSYYRIKNSGHVTN